MKKLAIITTHPIQYYAPLFKLLAERKKIIVKVFYTWGEKGHGKVFDPGFGKSRQWDIPLLEGYEYEFVSNISSDPGSHNYFGIHNPGLKKILYNWNPDVLLVFGWKFRTHLKIMRHFKTKIPILFRGDSTLLNDKKGFSLKKKFRHFSLSRVYRHIDFALYVGTNNKAYFSAIGLSDDQLVFAPHVIDNDRFGNNEEYFAAEASKWKQELNVPQNKPVVLFSGKLEPKKNPLFLVEAARNFPGIHFIIAGNGELESVIKEKSKSLENITLLPFQNQSKMPVVYRLADIFVLPSKGGRETWGLAINEAMACGRIVIASNKCGAAVDLVKSGENGFIIEPVYEKFSEALHTIMNNKSGWDLMKKKSLELIQLYNLDNLCERIEEAVINSTTYKHGAS